MAIKAAANAIDEIAGGCLAAKIRVIARTVTAIYEDAIHSHGLTIAQVNLLAALGKAGPCSPSRLGEKLQLERSTVSRNLDLLLASCWARTTTSDGKGKREVELTALGEKKLQAVLPAWRKAQAEAAQLVGEPGVQAVRKIAQRVSAHVPQSPQFDR